MEITRDMGFLGFVDWRAMHMRFCVLMWLIAGALLVVVLAHTGGSAASSLHHALPPPRR